MTTASNLVVQAILSKDYRLALGLMKMGGQANLACETFKLDPVMAAFHAAHQGDAPWKFFHDVSAFLPNPQEYWTLEENGMKMLKAMMKIEALLQQAKAKDSKPEAIKRLEITAKETKKLLSLHCNQHSWLDSYFSSNPDRYGILQGFLADSLQSMLPGQMNFSTKVILNKLIYGCQEKVYKGRDKYFDHPTDYQLDRLLNNLLLGPSLFNRINNSLSRISHEKAEICTQEVALELWQHMDKTQRVFYLERLAYFRKAISVMPDETEKLGRLNEIKRVVETAHLQSQMQNATRVAGALKL